MYVFVYIYVCVCIYFDIYTMRPISHILSLMWTYKSDGQRLNPLQQGSESLTVFIFITDWNMRSAWDYAKIQIYACSGRYSNSDSILAD